MGYRIAILNKPVKEVFVQAVKKKFRKYKMKVIDVVRINRKYKVHMVTLSDGRHIRLDNYSGRQPYQIKEKVDIQKLLRKRGVNVAKVIGVEKLLFGRPEKITTWKISEWIEGERLLEYWNDREIIEKCGEQVAKINSIRTEEGACICLGDFTALNAIVTEDKEVYIIDLSVYPCKSVSQSVFKTLIMSLRNKERIGWFLEGYERFKSTEKILKIAEKSNWKWKKYPLKYQTIEEEEFDKKLEEKREMHKTQIEWCQWLVKTYPSHFRKKRVLDVGSLNVNGTNRVLFKKCDYVGVDVIEGKGVDVVTIAHEYEPEHPFDVVLSTNALEHDIYYKKTLKKMVDVLKPGGMMFISAPYKWHVHGTKDVRPHSSGTSKMHEEWANYYKNLTIEDITETLDLPELFREYYIGIAERDLRFWGFKR